MEMGIEKQTQKPKKCIELVKEFEEREKDLMGEQIFFEGVGGKDVYNITAPFDINNKKIIVGRVEERDSIAKSKVMFFEEKNGVWYPVENSPEYPLEDGFITRIGRETIFGGVEVYPEPSENNPNEVGYRTVFYRGNDLYKFEKFASGPNRMKDIRLIDLKNGKIGVFTRPQGKIGGRGKIGYLEIDSLKDLNNHELILNAKIIEGQFVEDEWGGTNTLELLPDGKIGVVGHIAYIDEINHKHYYGMTFIYDPKNHYVTPIKILATIKNFPKIEPKSPDLADIVFPNSLIKNGNGKSILYTGLGDAKAGKLEVNDPFI